MNFFKIKICIYKLLIYIFLILFTLWAFDLFLDDVKYIFVGFITCLYFRKASWFVLTYAFVVW